MMAVVLSFAIAVVYWRQAKLRAYGPDDPRRAEELKKIDLRMVRILFGGALLFLLYYCVVVTPRGMSYKHKLKSLRPEQVQTVRLHTEELVDGRLVTEERTLKRNDIAEFLALISKARSYSPNHPRGGWTCFVDIFTTTATPRFSFLIHSTTNNGVYFSLTSNSDGRNGWSYGALRNDALGPFIEALFN
jgi:hypothetical protein